MAILTLSYNSRRRPDEVTRHRRVGRGQTREPHPGALPCQRWHCPRGGPRGSSLQVRCRRTPGYPSNPLPPREASVANLTTPTFARFSTCVCVSLCPSLGGCQVSISTSVLLEPGCLLTPCACKEPGSSSHARAVSAELVSGPKSKAILTFPRHQSKSPIYFTRIHDFLILYTDQIQVTRKEWSF